MTDRAPTPEQQRAAEEFRRLRGVDPFGPFIPLLDSPELMTRVSALGEYLRFRSALPAPLRELAILVTAAHWKQQYEWDVHAPVARQAGLPEVALDAVWLGRKPADLTAEQAALYDLCVALHRDRAPDAGALARARDALGEQGLIDAIALCGYYAMLAMILNSQ